MQWLFDIIIEQMENAGFIRITDVELYLKGMIVAWSGTLANIPDGWALCDGNNGTPDLKIKFVLGAWDPGTPHASGGSIFHTHTFTGDGHSHHSPLGAGLPGGVLFDTTTSSDPAVGTTDNQPDLPPYYVLAYIMKL